MNERLTILCGDSRDMLKTLPDESVQCCVTSPPYWGLRDYGVDGQLGLEPTPEAYVSNMVQVFREVRRVLREDGTLWLNLGDSYHGSWGNSGNRPELDGATQGQRYKETEYMPRGGWDERRDRPPSSFKLPGLKPKDLVGIPWRVAFALQADGWWLRQDIIWNKPSCMPESVTDRCTKAHEYIFLLAKSASYFYDHEAIKVPASDSYKNDSRWETGPTEENEKHGYELAGARNPKRVHGVFNGDAKQMVNRRSVWTVTTNPYSEAHFATYPPDLIKPCILSGTSARGCCSTCGAPWSRVVERIPSTSKKCPKTDALYQAQGGDGPKSTGTIGMSGGGRINGSSTTLDWQATCKCADPPLPCTVLDPFAGSGTTGMVALELGRKAVLIELNPEYVKLIESRTFVTPGLALA